MLAITISSNLRLSEAPGNVFLESATSGLDKDSVANVSQIVTLDRRFLTEQAGSVDERVMSRIARGLRKVLDL